MCGKGEGRGRRGGVAENGRWLRGRFLYGALSRLPGCMKLPKLHQSLLGISQQRRHISCLRWQLTRFFSGKSLRIGNVAGARALHTEPLTGLAAYVILLPKLVSYLGGTKPPSPIKGHCESVLAAPKQLTGNLLYEPRPSVLRLAFFLCCQIYIISISKQSIKNGMACQSIYRL